MNVHWTTERMPAVASRAKFSLSLSMVCKLVKADSEGRERGGEAKEYKYMNNSQQGRCQRGGAGGQLPITCCCCGALLPCARAHRYK